MPVVAVGVVSADFALQGEGRGRFAGGGGGEGRSVGSAHRLHSRLGAQQRLWGQKLWMCVAKHI